MHKCLELSKLPKAPRVSSIIFRGQTPGSVPQWPIYLPRPQNRLDPNHPVDLGSSKKPKYLLWTRPTSAFTLGALPMGLLLKPENNSRYGRGGQPLHAVDLWSARLARGAPTGSVAPAIPSQSHPTRLAMSLQMQSSSNLRTHQRTQVLRRFKTALVLIAARGAAAKEVKGRLELVFDENDIDGWILQGWTYYLKPTLELYRIPYPKLVQMLRPVLREIWTGAHKMEADWTAASLGSRGKPQRPQPRDLRRPPGSFTGDRSPQPPVNFHASSESTSRKPPPRQRVSDDDSFGLKRPTVQRVTPESLPPVPDFDPFPTVSASPPGSSATTSRAGPSPVVDPKGVDSLPAEPDFDPFPSMRAAPLPVSDLPLKSQSVAHQDSEPDFDQFPSVSAPVPAVDLPASTDRVRSGSSQSAPNPTTSPKPVREASPSKGHAWLHPQTDWWAVGRTIEGAIGQHGAEGTTRWDRQGLPPSPLKKEKENAEVVQSRLTSMLYKQKEVARPDSEERAAQRRPRRFEEKK
ncbi:hypothetical protein DFH06DRAFT_1171670 [Mycena polygramma]|nr:hypothetical protein DFH06DRAFT_1171670 [Mycena polygramma]